MTTAHILVDEHAGRVFERLLREREHEVAQAKDRFGEYTTEGRLRPPRAHHHSHPTVSSVLPGAGWNAFC
ncbi:hypothetical protein DJ76_01785 [Halorubrum ezzemoulense]|uniref:Uncharacterized protein n=1 Tax=Halorubrum ezzemoulense TaxID=337243 RepID=A0A256K5B9_HALEZ|nr:hypothetical protein DJ76_01785 [Halorubrum ezzemoulense]